MRFSLAVIVAVLTAIAGCGKSHPEDKYTHVEGDDAAMNAAIEKAHSSINTFIAVLRSPKADQSQFSIKVPIVDGDKTEHMWLAPVTYDGTKFEGVVSNYPDDVKNVQFGQKLSVEPSKVSDWMFVENGKLVGGYTLRVLRSRLPDGERAEFDKSLAFKID